MADSLRNGPDGLLERWVDMGDTTHARKVHVASGTGTSATAVQGTAADGAAAVGNPVQVGGVDASGNLQALVVDTSGRAQVIEPLQATADYTGARINVAAAGDTALVTATALQTTRVHGLRLNASGPVIVTLKDGATVLEVFNLAGAGAGVVLDFRGRPYYVGTVNTALNINLSAAVQVDGRLEYVKSA